MGEDGIKGGVETKGTAGSAKKRKGGARRQEAGDVREGPSRGHQIIPRKNATLGKLGFVVPPFEIEPQLTEERRQE